MWNYNLVTGLGNESLSIQCESVFKCLESMVNPEVRETLLGTVGVRPCLARWEWQKDMQEVHTLGGWGVL